MRIVSAADVDRLLDFPRLIAALRSAFAGAVVQPVRHHHRIERNGEAADSTLLLMPAWTDFRRKANGYAGVKIVSVSPDNAAVGLPSVLGSYLLLDGATLQPVALVDGPSLTAWRTAAASALAATFLARKDSATHLVIGAGAMAPFLIRAMRAVRPIRRTLIWNRSPERVEALVTQLGEAGIAVEAAPDLDAAVAGADVVSAATLSREALVRGRFLEPGTHVDLVGAFAPDMRESDDEAVRRARVFVDTRDGALTEGGDLVQAVAAGAFEASRVVADLFELCRGTASGRESAGEITLFKSTGAALEDLAAAVLVFESLEDQATASVSPSP
ncbi:ornithine cyclodeaminase family protein [Aureimonas leprariae]|uniref:Ornithine cyclodeaminase family protein n=1 Tax=Plantimonas leprariae TaxID=2615207 RepID=A0A7V7U206_9HYPH|nr:ornithine cyclodeaminase family protein [Aureimonas leprariae]KAB0682868.1 ornithine cyclodeaminase family protein [Aureimonas leprariae]